jgi:hypothetical protein
MLIYQAYQDTQAKENKMKKIALALALLPSLSQAWTVAQIQANMQFPSATGKASCFAPHPTKAGSSFTTNAQQGTTAGTDNLRVGFGATTNVTQLPGGGSKATGNAAITTFKAINLYFTEAGQNHVVTIPANTYWGTATSSYRTTLNEAVAFVPSTGLPYSLRMTAYPIHHVSTLSGTIIYKGIDLKITLTLASGQVNNYWFGC